MYSAIAGGPGSSQKIGPLSLDDYRPILWGWITGKLPPWARIKGDTDDMVQVVLERAWDNLERFADQPEEGFRAFLRRIVQHELIDRIRDAKRHGIRVDLPEDFPHPSPSPLEVLIEAEFAEKVQQLLKRLGPRRRRAFELRLRGHKYPEIARLMSTPEKSKTANGARMLVARALEDLVRMAAERTPPKPPGRRKG